MNTQSNIIWEVRGYCLKLLGEGTSDCNSMAQEQLLVKELDLSVKTTQQGKKRKICYKLDGTHYISVFKNDMEETVINIRKGTRSVSVSKEMWTEICDLKETVLLCASFVDNE